MEKLGIKIKQLTGSFLEKNFRESYGLFFVRYGRINGLALSTLRKNLKLANARMFVTKNTVAQRLFNGLGKKDLNRFIEGPIAFVFFRDDPVAISKIIVDFAKEHENLIVEGGILYDSLLDRNSVSNLARLPSKEILLAQVVGGIKSPLSNLVFTLSGIIRKFAVALQQIKKNKERS